MVYGNFAMDLKAATGEPGVPKNTASETGVAHAGDSENSNIATVLHALIMGACFVILFPIGSLLIRLPFRLAFWLHLIWQSVTVLGVLIGFALGVSVSIKNQKHPKLNSVHQGLGMAVVLLVLIQPTLGFLHHRSYKQSASPTILSKIHRAYLGPAVILLGIINGAVGLDFASNKEKLPAYFGFVIFIAIITALAQWVARRKKMRSNAVNSVAASNFREGAVYGDVPLQSYGRTNGNNINHSQQSFAQAGVAPPQYVNVMPKNPDQRMS
jgi:Eukaryotic cytochrome b561